MRAERFELRLGDIDYPPQLALTPRPPMVLFGVGDPTALVDGFAVVGARRATPYGLGVAERFAGWAARQGATIVSGAAIGCDQAAQRAALAAEGMSVGVLGCGADVDYPSRASDLLRLLRGGRGAVVSELPWGSPPQRWAFRERNRIIAGLSACVLIVEAALPSGTFSTADFAAECGRDVLAVPGSIFAPESRGPNRLIAQGATPITDVSELSEALIAAGLLSPQPSPNDESMSIASADPLMRALLADPMRPDDVARQLDLDIVSVLRRVAALEAQGVVARYPDGRYGPR